ncbi:MAG: GAF domain-containing protein [Litorilinea sp.]
MTSSDAAGIIEYASDGIALTDENGLVTLWNTSLERMTGIPQSAAVGRYMWEVLVGLFPAYACTPGAVAYCWQHIYTCLKGDTPNPSQDCHEFHLQLPGGEIRQLQMASFSIPTAHGFQVGCICRDITDSRKNAAQDQLHNEELALINWASTVFTSILDLDEVLHAVMQEVLHLSPADGVGIWLHGETDRQLTLQASTNRAGNPFPMHHATNFARMARWVFEKNQKLAIRDLWADDATTKQKTYHGKASIRSCVFVPLQLKEDVIGALNIHSPQADQFVPNNVALLESLSIPAAIAIHNAQLYKRVKEFTSARERQYISQYLHDLVNQSFTSVSLITESLPELWEQNPEEGLNALRELQKSVRGAVAEQRRALAELRSPDLTVTDLADLLRTLATTSAQQMNIPVEFGEKGRGEVPSDVQVMLYRICQEALNNIRKHAGAEKVSIQLDYTGTTVSLRIFDDGIGFDVQRVPNGHYGLQIMHERAKTVGARLHISSAPAKGTEVDVVWSENTDDEPNFNE